MIAARPFAEFNRLLARAVEQGVPAAEAVALVAGSIDSRRLRAALDEVAAALREGASLPAALRRRPDAFPADYAAQVEAGIAANRLPEVLRQVESYHALRDRTRRHLTRLVVYASLVTTACLLAMAAFLPLGSLGRDLWWDSEGAPAVTRFWIWAADHPAVLFLSAPAAAAIAATGLWLLGPVLSATRAEYWVPLWGGIRKNRDLATICNALGMRLSIGGDVVAGLRGAEAGTRNRALRAALRRAGAGVAEGRPLSDALYAERLFPRTLVWATSMGEASGDLGRVFRFLGRVYAAEMERGFETLNVLATPVAMIAVGNIALLAALAIVLPILQPWGLW